MIRQWSVHAVPGRRRPSDAYILVLQSHFTETESVLVAPLLATPHERDVTRLMVRVTVLGGDYVVHFGELASVPRRLLTKPIADLRDFEDEFRRALDRILGGF